MTAAIFGTDGIRGRAYQGWLGLEAVAAIGHAAGSVLAPDGGRALLGNDGRRSGPDLERALAAGLRAAGVEPWSCGLMTPPGLAWLVRAEDFALGAMVSASHNPAADNGIKLFSTQGGKLTDETQHAVEVRLRRLDVALAQEPLLLRGEREALDCLAEHSARIALLSALVAAGWSRRVLGARLGRYFFELFQALALRRAGAADEEEERDRQYVSSVPHAESSSRASVARGAVCRTIQRYPMGVGRLPGNQAWRG